MRTDRPIMLVEDDEVDRMTVERALKEIHVTNPLITARDGEEALRALRAPDAERPGIILLDLNMPGINGIELLKALKQDEELRRIPVVVLTTSKDEQDRVYSFDLGVAGYMIKPVDYIQFMEVVKTVDMYWTLSELPE